MLNNEFVAAFRQWELWFYLACQDVRLRYRRSKIGPFWITLSMAVFCVSLGLVYSQLFKADVREYLPFLSVGFVFWGLIAGMLGEYPNVFVENAGYLKDIRINPCAILLRLACRHLITFAHNLLILVGIYLYFGFFPGIIGLWAVPGLVLVVCNLFAIGVSLALCGARFRDIAPITQSLLQVLFFISPVTWLPRLLPADHWVMVANPIAFYLDLVRSPLLGHPPSAQSWWVALGTLVVFSLLAAGLYRQKAARIPFWV